MLNVAVGYCHRPTIPHTFLECMIQLWKSKLVDVIINEPTFFIASGRNKVVEQFLKFDEEWLLFIDDDIIFQPKQIEQIMKLADKKERPILAGLYFSKLSGDAQINPVWLEKHHESGLFRTVSYLKGTDDDNGLQSIDICGMGFTLIHRSVFEKMQESRKDIKDDWVWFGHDMKSDGTRLGEDTTFCIRAKNLGFPIYGVTSIQLTHLKTHMYGAKMFLEQETKRG